MKELYKYGDLVTVRFAKLNSEVVEFTAIVEEVDYYKGDVLYDIKVPILRVISDDKDAFLYMKGVNSFFIFDYKEATPNKKAYIVFPKVAYDDSIILNSEIPNIEL